MKVPKTIHFSGFDYKVIEVENLDGGENWGRSHVDRGEIWLEKKVTEQKKFETLIHELVHIALRHTSKSLSNEDEEKIIKPWASNIYGILKDNNLLK